MREIVFEIELGLDVHHGVLAVAQAAQILEIQRIVTALERMAEFVVDFQRHGSFLLVESSQLAASEHT